MGGMENRKDWGMNKRNDWGGGWITGKIGGWVDSKKDRGGGRKVHWLKFTIKKLMRHPFCTVLHICLACFYLHERM